VTGEDKDFERIQPQTRLAILEIVRETKLGLPAYWK